MHIDSIDIYHLCIPRETTLNAANRSLREFETVLVRLNSGQDAGWGEAPVGAAPIDAAEWAAGVFVCLRDWLAPAIVDQQIDSAAALQQRVARFAGNEFAKSALDGAWWQLQAKLAPSSSQSQPKSSSHVPVTLELIPCESIDTLLTAIQSAINHGVSRFHLQLRPGWDIEVLRAVRQCFSGQTISVGCGGQLTLDQKDFFYRLEDFHLAYIEQPLDPDDIVGHAMLQESLRTPIALRHSATSVNRVRQAIDLGAARNFVIEPGRAGGRSLVLQMLDLCRNAAIPCTIASRIQTIVGASVDQTLCSIDPVASWQIPWLESPGDPLLAWHTPGDIAGKSTTAPGPSVTPDSFASYIRAYTRVG